MLVIFIRKREALMRPPGAVALAGLLLGVETRHLLANWGEESGAGEEGESTSSSLRLDSSEGARAWKM